MCTGWEQAHTVAPRQHVKIAEESNAEASSTDDAWPVEQTQELFAWGHRCQ
jgi:hypothetical protein